MSDRAETFQKLKPHCIRLSQDAIAFAGNSGSVISATKSLEELLRALKSAQSRHDDVDERLAEYVFWPLSHILKASQKLPGRTIELVLECIIILLQTGWRRTIPTATALQLLILLSFLTSTSDSKNKALVSSEELQVVSFRCLSDLLKSFSYSTDAKKALLATENIPTTGNCIFKILEGILLGRSSDIQLAAVEALNSSYEAITDQQALASFLPGVVSQLSKVLTPNTTSRRSYKVLQLSLDGLSKILLLVVSDKKTTKLPSAAAGTSSKTALTQSWLKASAGQIRQALSNVVKLRHHAREEVREAMVGLCTIVIHDCQASLAECSEMMLDTLVALSRPDVQNIAFKHLQRSLGTNPTSSEQLKSMLHGWIVSLPRVMASQNDDSKQAVLHRISVCFRLLQEEKLGLANLENTMASNLRDSVTTLIKQGHKPIVGATSDDLKLISRVRADIKSKDVKLFEPVIAGTQLQEQTISHVHGLLEQLCTSQSALGMAEDLLVTAQYANGDPQLAAFWLAKSILEIVSTKHNDNDLSDLIDVETDSTSHELELSETLYSLAISILVDSTNESDSDWRLQALAIETISSQATQLGVDFRSELIEVLYPLLHLLGTTNPHIQSHALTCLNIVSEACQYDFVSDMLVQNVDYLVNAVGLKLNAFELSPQAPQVLLMMIRLSGPTLLPYLEDLAGSMFSALESFHGYPKLVELIFQVFKAVSEEGAKTPRLAITDGRSKKDDIAFHPASIADITSIVEDIRARSAMPRETEVPEPFPQEAWKSMNSGEDDPEADTEEPSEDKDIRKRSDDADLPPVPKIYSLLLRITEVTQHYLPSSSPAIRASLLSLLYTTIPALAAHENSFLPLINTIWPVLVPRLDDPEAFVVANTLEVIGLMCLHGGNFMKSRINDLWPTLLRLDPRKKLTPATSRSLSSKPDTTMRQLLRGSENPLSLIATKDDLSGPLSQANTSYVDSPSRMIWNSYVELIKTIIGHVVVEEEKFDDALDALEPLLRSQRDVRDVFEARNPDAVWLKLRPPFEAIQKVA